MNDSLRILLCDLVRLLPTTNDGMETTGEVPDTAILHAKLEAAKEVYILKLLIALSLTASPL